MLTKKKPELHLEFRHTQNTHEPFLSSPAQEFVPEVGLEPTYRKALDPKSSASTNFATRAYYFKNVLTDYTNVRSESFNV